MPLEGKRLSLSAMVTTTLTTTTTWTTTIAAAAAAAASAQKDSKNCFGRGSYESGTPIFLGGVAGKRWFPTPIAIQH